MAILDLSRAPHGGRTRLLPDNRSSPRITPRLLILHSIVGSAEGAYRYFRDVTNLESTFIVTLAGEIWQLMDTTREADANYRANPFAISVETEDRGDPDNQPWTARQLDALAWLAWECARIHRIPLRRASRWDGSGVGFHTLFGAPGAWTPVSKSCPGRARIRQFHDVLLPRIIRGPQQHEEVDMPLDAADKTFLNGIKDAITGKIDAAFDLLYNGRDFTTRQTVPGNVSLKTLRDTILGPTNPPAGEPSIRELLTTLQSNPPGGEVVVVQLSSEQATALTGNVMAAVERGVENLNVALDPADRDAIINGVTAQVLAAISRAGQAAALAVEPHDEPEGELS